MSGEKAIFVVRGPDWDDAFKGDNVEKLKELEKFGYKVFIIGDSKKPISDAEISGEESELKKYCAANPNAKVTLILNAHGSVNEAGKHEIDTKTENNETEALIFEPMSEHLGPVGIFASSCEAFAVHDYAHKDLHPKDKVVSSTGMDVAYGNSAAVDYADVVEIIKNDAIKGIDRDVLDVIVQAQLKRTAYSTGLIYTIPGVGSHSMKESILEKNDVSETSLMGKGEFGSSQYMEYQKIKISEGDIVNDAQARQNQAALMNMSVEEVADYTKLQAAIRKGDTKAVDDIFQKYEKDHSMQYLFNGSKKSVIDFHGAGGLCKSTEMVQHLYDKGVLVNNEQDALEIVSDKFSLIDKNFFMNLVCEKELYKNWGYKDEQIFKLSIANKIDNSGNPTEYQKKFNDLDYATLMRGEEREKKFDEMAAKMELVINDYTNRATSKNGLEHIRAEAAKIIEGANLTPDEFKYMKEKTLYDKIIVTDSKEMIGQDEIMVLGWRVPCKLKKDVKIEELGGKLSMDQASEADELMKPPLTSRRGVIEIK